MSSELSSIPAFISREQTGDLAILSFNVSNSYEMPVSLLTSHITQFENVLTFASKLIEREKSVTDEFTRDSLFAEYLKDIKRLHASEISDIQTRSVSEMTNKIGPLIESIETQRAKYEQQIKTLQKSLETIRSEKESEIEEQTRPLRKKIAQIESELEMKSQAESLIREQCRAEFEQRVALIESKNREILAMKDSSLQDQKERLEKREQELMRKVHRNAASCFRGQDGEQFFADLATEKMKWVMTFTGDTDHSCDYSTVIQNVPSFIEVKNYTDTIPFKEVTKFLSDMKAHPEITFGVFVSLNTGIQKKQATPISMDWINGTQCVMYIQSFVEQDQDQMFLIIEQTARLAGIITRNILQKDGENVEANYQQRIEDAKTYITNSISRLNKLHTKVKNDKMQLISLLETSSSGTMNEIKHQTVELTNAVQIMLGETVDLTSYEEKEEPLNEVVAPQSKPKKKTKKAAAPTSAHPS